VADLPVICDRHEEAMTRDHARMEYRCPRPDCGLLITDEARFHLLSSRPGIREIRVDEMSARQEALFAKRPALRGTLLDLGYK
jgi:hypothetical protein